MCQSMSSTSLWSCVLWSWAICFVLFCHTGESVPCEQIVQICSLVKLCRVAFADKLYQSVCVTPNCRSCASLRCMFGFKAISDQRVQRHPEAKASQILALEFWMYWWTVRVFPTHCMLVLSELGFDVNAPSCFGSIWQTLYLIDSDRST